MTIVFELTDEEAAACLKTAAEGEIGQGWYLRTYGDTPFGKVVLRTIEQINQNQLTSSQQNVAADPSQPTAATGG